MSQPGHACARIALTAAALIALVFPSVLLASPQSGHEISGVYEIADVTNAGNSVRVTLHISLTSRTDSDFSVSSFALRSVMSDPRPKETPATLSVRSHASSEFTQAFTVSEREFRQWQKGVRPTLFLRLVSPDGSRLTRTIQLAPGFSVRPSPLGGER